MMAETIRTEKQLWEALKEKADTILIEGDLIRKVLRLRMLGGFAWFVAAGMLAIWVIILSIASGGTDSPAPHMVGYAAMGSGTAIGAFAASTNRLRRYKECERSDDRLILKR